MGNLWQVVSGVLGVMLIGVLGYGYVTVTGLEIKVSTLVSDVVKAQGNTLLAETNHRMCKHEVKAQNELVEALKADYSGKIDELEKWKAKAPEIRYNTIYKYIPREVNIHEESCENTKLMLDAVRNINFDQL